MIKNSRVAVIIVNWKKYKITANCIESVIKCNYPNFEIILVDNGSDIHNINDYNKTILASLMEGDKTVVREIF